MKKILALLPLLILLTSCGGNGGEPLPDTENDIEIIQNGINGNTTTEYEESEIEPLPPEIPRYDEYHVTLEIDPEQRLVSGISFITFTNRTSVALDTVVLRVYLNAFDEGVYPPPVFSELEWRAFYHGRDYGRMEITDAILDHETLDFELGGTVLTLFLPEPLEPYATAQLHLVYNAEIPLISHRTGGNDYALWFGMFLPTLAVFDETHGEWHTEAHYPAGSPFVLETANFTVDITTPTRYTVVGTGLRTEEVNYETDIKITRFVAHQARDFAFALSPYFRHASAATESGINIHLYYYTEELPAEEILEAALRGMNHFEEYVGIFPLGHVTIVETDLLVDSASFSQMIFMDSWYLGRGGRYWAMAHALGNQWFANIIGTNRIADPWLTQGLTRFVQARIFYPTDEELRDRMERDRFSIEDRTTLQISRGLDASPNHQHYVHTHGRKAMLMCYALYRRMGAELFWQLIAEYYQTFSFRLASTSDFIALAEEIYGDSLQEFFGEWLTLGTVPELP